MRSSGDMCSACHAIPYMGMNTHHCCEPTHRNYDEKMRRMRRELQEARSRADWLELNEGILADRLDEARQEIERLKRS